MILGIREKAFLKLNRPLNYSDLTTLHIANNTRWNGKLVADEIEKLEPTIGKIKYAVGDYGNDLRKGLSLTGIDHIHDLSHLIALITKKIYNKDDRFIGFKKEMINMRTKFIQTDIAAIVPPKGRRKSEYQSFDKIIRWANSILNLIENKLNDPLQIEFLLEYFEIETLDKIKKELAWVSDYSELITELSEISKAIKIVEKEMKHKGLSKNSLEKCKKHLAKIESCKGKEFKEELLSKINNQLQILPKINTILFSTDILESVFGKYKNRVSENPMASVTSLMLIIAAFTSDLNEENIRKSIENVKIEDVKKWSKKNIGTSLYKKRKVLLAA